MNFTQSIDQFDFCGQKKLYFTLNGTRTTLLSAINGDYITLITDDDFNSYGQA